MMNQCEIRQMMLKRTKHLAISIIKLTHKFPSKTAYWVIGKQIVKSSTSTATNYNTTNLARSRKEFYAKLCIVVEECNETIIWLNILEEADLIKPEDVRDLIKETTELLSILSKSKKTTKTALNKKTS